MKHHAKWAILFVAAVAGLALGLTIGHWVIADRPVAAVTEECHYCGKYDLVENLVQCPDPFPSMNIGRYWGDNSYGLEWHRRGGYTNAPMVWWEIKHFSETVWAHLEHAHVTQLECCGKWVAKNPKPDMTWETRRELDFAKVAADIMVAEASRQPCRRPHLDSLHPQWHSLSNNFAPVIPPGWEAITNTLPIDGCWVTGNVQKAIIELKNY